VFKLDIQNIIETINDTLAMDLTISKEFDKNITARSLIKYMLIDNKNKRYLLEIATNNIEIFYFKRTIEYQEKFSKLKHNFKLNMPLYVQSGNKLSYALYEYFDDISFFSNSKPIDELVQFYEENSIEIETTDENIDKILANFLSAWPNQFHSMIKRQKEFQDYEKKLRQFTTIKVSYEHGDFTTNNIFNVSNDLYLMDFEFSRDFQPIGFDSYDYATSTKNISKYENNFYYKDLHCQKYNLIEKTNKKVDNYDKEIEMYDNLDDPILKENWIKLYNKGANYNLSFVWCNTWLKHFKKTNQDIFIFTIWNDEKLVFLAPLYKSKNNLYLIGSNPDLFDSFGLLYENEKYIKQFYDFIFKNNYNIDFRYLDADSMIAKVLIKYFYQNNITYDSKIIDTKPKTEFDSFKIKTKENSDIKRCKNRAIKSYRSELGFKFSIKKDDKTFSEFIQIHKERWHGGPFQDIENFDLFIKDISQTDLVILSKLYIKNKTVAYHFTYMDSNSILNSAIPSYSNEYNAISPGKVLLFEILEYCKNNNYKVFDFGRGAEEYKYWFSNESSILFHIKTYSNSNILIKLKNLSNRIFNKLNRIFYV